MQMTDDDHTAAHSERREQQQFLLGVDQAAAGSTRVKILDTRDRFGIPTECKCKMKATISSRYVRD